MARPRVPASKRDPQVLGEVAAVTVSLRVDVTTMVRLEKVLHQRMLASLQDKGERCTETVSMLIREAIADWLDKHAGKATIVSRVRAPGRPRK